MGVSTGALLALAAALQIPQASVSGVVTDADTGRPIGAATVRLVESGVGVLSDEEGWYALRGVAAGPQHLRVAQLGYASRTIHALVPAAGELVLHIALRSEPLELAGLDVESRAFGSLVPAADERLGGERRVSAATLRRHPLLAEPDAFRALAGRGVVVDPEAPYGLPVRGGDPNHTGFSLNGIPVLDPVHSAGLFSAWNADALEGVALSPAAPSSSLPDALSGVVQGTLRAPGERASLGTSVSTTHAALTARGPLAGAGYVLSFRSGFPGLVSPARDPSYLRGESGDAIMAVSVPWIGGSLEALYYSSDNELTLGRLMDPSTGASTGGGPSEWASRSVGLSWRRARSSAALEVKAWRATSTTVSAWIDATESWSVDSNRQDLGVQATLRRATTGTRRELGVRLWRVSTGYSAAPSSFRVEGGTVVASVFGEQASALGAGLHARVGGALSAAGGRVYTPAHAELSWSSGQRWTWRASVARTHQFTQSLANTESIARHVLPFDLPVAAATGGVPVPRSDQLVLAAEWLATSGVHLSAEGYVRRLRDLLLVARVEAAPFARGTVPLGQGSARGLSLEAVGAGARVQWLARYDWQRVSRLARDAYQPAHGTAHIASAGLTVNPGPTWSIRFGVDAALGRRGSEIVGPFEWEACNLADRGCEFAGTPLVGRALGQVGLPTYWRTDVGLRKHWHLSLRGRSTSLGVFGTLTNVLGRSNVLTYARDATGTLRAVDMLPFGPLVVGLDWQF